MMRANKKLSPQSNSTEWSAYQNLKRSYEHGLMHENFVKSFKEMDARFKKFTEDFAPYYMLRLAWTAFWSIRSTKAQENPICHSDILAYKETMYIDLTPTEVQLILNWDRLYYKYLKKYQSNA